MQKFHIFTTGEKKNPNKTYLKCLCVCFAKSRGDPSFMLLFLCASIVIVCELLAPFNEAVLTVTPWAGKCYYIHFTGRELKHIGTKWFVEVHTWCIAEQGLEITFQITGLELLPEVLHSPSSYSAIPVFSTATCPPPQTPLHHVLHLISFWAWGQLNHLNHQGLHKKVKFKKAHYAYI